MAPIYIGTCSWTDKSLIDSKRFYPRTAKSAEDRLRYYAGIFPTVEVDSSYYAMPMPETAGQWVERTPEHFVFHVKAFRLFTGHWAMPQVLPPDLREEAVAASPDKRRLYLSALNAGTRDALWSRFEDALLPLDSAGKLGVVLLQFAPWFIPGPEAFDHIDECRRRLPQYRVAVEFRNHAWFTERQADRTLEFLRERHLSHVVVDEPQGFSNSVPPLAAVTDDIAYVRFHGRNAKTWQASTGTSAERFDHWYTEDELREWVPRITQLMEESSSVHLLFNTNNDSQGPDNATLMAKVLFDHGLGDSLVPEGGLEQAYRKGA